MMEKGLTCGRAGIPTQIRVQSAPHATVHVGQLTKTITQCHQCRRTVEFTLCVVAIGFISEYKKILTFVPKARTMWLYFNVCVSQNFLSESENSQFIRWLNEIPQDRSSWYSDVTWSKCQVMSPGIFVSPFIIYLPPVGFFFTQALPSSRQDDHQGLWFYLNNHIYWTRASLSSCSSRNLWWHLINLESYVPPWTKPCGQDGMLWLSRLGLSDSPLLPPNKVRHMNLG